MKNVIGNILYGIALLLGRFKSTETFANEMLSSRDVGIASRALQRGDNATALKYYRQAIARGGDTVGEQVAKMRIKQIEGYPNQQMKRTDTPPLT